MQVSCPADLWAATTKPICDSSPRKLSVTDKVVVHLDGVPQNLMDPTNEINIRLKVERLMVLIKDVSTGDKPADQPSDRPADQPTDQSTDRSTDRPTDRSTALPTDGSIDRSTDQTSNPVNRSRPSAVRVKNVIHGVFEDEAQAAHQNPKKKMWTSLVEELGEKTIDKVLCDYDEDMAAMPAFHLRLEAFKKIKREQLVHTLSRLQSDYETMNTSFPADATPTELRMKVLRCLVVEHCMPSGSSSTESESSGGDFQSTTRRGPFVRAADHSSSRPVESTVHNSSVQEVERTVDQSPVQPVEQTVTNA